MNKETILQAAGQLVGAIVMSAGLVLGGTYAYKEFVLDGQLEKQAVQSPTNMYVIVSE